MKTDIDFAVACAKNTDYDVGHGNKSKTSLKGLELLEAY